MAKAAAMQAPNTVKRRAVISISSRFHEVEETGGQDRPDDQGRIERGSNEHTPPSWPK
jgi:hypothetical protein